MGYTHGTRYNLTDEQLIDEYVTQRMTSYQISDLHNIGNDAVWKHLKRLNIIRPRSGENSRFSIPRIKEGDPLLDKAEPKVGDIRLGRAIGKPKQGRFIWLPCNYCGEARWVPVAAKTGKVHGGSILCRKCVGKGGRLSTRSNGVMYTGEGYRAVKNYKGSPYHKMANKANYILEHRLIMAKHIGRCLYPWEVVHHINGDRLDNRIENLQLMTTSSHTIDTQLKHYVVWLENKIEEAEKLLIYYRKSKLCL